MGCVPTDFILGPRYRPHDLPSVTVANAWYKASPEVNGVCWWLDGRFMGFTGSERAVRYYVAAAPIDHPGAERIDEYETTAL